MTLEFYHKCMSIRGDPDEVSVGGTLPEVHSPLHVLPPTPTQCREELVTCSSGAGVGSMMAVENQPVVGALLCLIKCNSMVYLAPLPPSGSGGVAAAA